MIEGDIIAPSAIPFNNEMKTPLEMTSKDIKNTITAFIRGR